MSDILGKETILKRMNEIQERKAAEVPVVPEEPKTKTAEQIQHDENYVYTQQKLKTLVEVGMDAIDNFKEIAQETGEPKAYSTLANLLKATADVTKAVMESDHNKLVIDEKSGASETKPSAFNNVPINGQATTSIGTIFVGSTKDLLDMVNKTVDHVPTPAETETK